MENNMEIDMQVCEPDSTYEITDLDNQPPPPSQLEIITQRHESQRMWCAEMLANAINTRADLRQRLDEAKQQCRSTRADLKIVSRTRERNAVAVRAAKAHLASIKAKCQDYEHALEIETSWEPSVTMTDEDLQELVDRVAKLRAMAELLHLSDVESPGSSGSS